MHRSHALRLALLCCVIVGVLAACGSSNEVQYNYGSLANKVCRNFIAATKSNPSPAERLQAIEDALSGLQDLNPPDTVQRIYTRVLYNFKAAVDLLKPNMDELTRLNGHLLEHPDDKRAARRYAALGGLKIEKHLQLAAAAAFTLGMGSCHTAFGG